jgi:hydrogenase nickel incorporation protein HypA/HybF
MHEYGLVAAIVRAVERRAAGRRVIAARVRVGARHRVVGPAMEQAFSLAAEGTVAEGARMDMVLVPMTVACRGCGHQGHSEDPLAVCEACGGVDVEVTGGDELILESVEYEAVAAGRGEGGEADVSRDPR